jgi:hypothetical protein
LTLQIQVSLKPTTSVRALQFNRNIGTKPISQPNQAPTPIGCLVFKEPEKSRTCLSFSISRQRRSCALYRVYLLRQLFFKKLSKKLTNPANPAITH